MIEVPPNSALQRIRTHVVLGNGRPSRSPDLALVRPRAEVSSPVAEPGS